MKIRFSKYQATGNDFIIVDNRPGTLKLTTEQVQRLCDRKFGVGADGLMLIERDGSSDFNLVYYNSDGSQSLCGNGSRAAVMFASSIGAVNGKTSFNAYDGLHDAEIRPDGNVRLRMNDVSGARNLGNDFFIDTGSPHYIQIVDSVENFPVVEKGRSIRYSADFQPGGTNVNFIALKDNNTIFVRTYERGVEDETLSCGTGVTAAALAASFHGYTSPVKIKTLGGELSVEFERNAGQDGAFTNIFLVGPAKMVFQGELEL
jgi:diaminopimelate epimerase